MSDHFETKANSRGHILHIWPAGEHYWACCAYDHGTMCRLCHKIEDPTELALLAQVAEGLMEVWAEPDGSFRFNLTDEGQAKAEILIATDPDARKLWNDAHISDFERQFDDDEGDQNGS